MQALGNVKIAMSVKGCMTGIRNGSISELRSKIYLRSDERGEAFLRKRKILHCLFSILRQYNFVGPPVAVLSDNSIVQVLCKLWPGSRRRIFREMQVSQVQ